MESVCGRALTVLCIGESSPGDPFGRELAKWLLLRVVSREEAGREALASGGLDAVLLVEADATGDDAAGGWRRGLLREAAPLPCVLVDMEPGAAENVAQSLVAAHVVRQPGETWQALAGRVSLEVERCVLKSSLIQGEGVLERLLECNPYAIAIQDRHGRHVRVNRAFLELLGSPAPADLCVFAGGLASYPALEALVGRLLRGETVTSPPVWFNPRQFHAGGTDRNFCVSLVAFPLAEGSEPARYFVTMFEDVTMRVQAEEALAEANRKLSEARAELEVRLLERSRAHEEELRKREVLQRRLLDKNQELEDFAFRVGHDLKNGLFAIRSILEVARLDPSVAESASEVVVETTQRLIDFVERLLQMARAGRVIGARKATDLAGLVERVFARCRPAGTAADLILAPDLPEVVVDAAAMEQALAKIVDNSFQHRDPERTLRIDVSATRDGQRAAVHVRDNGLGIQPQVLQGIFSMCFRGEEGERIGFGLTIARKIVEAHGGELRVESEGRGHGVDVTLWLPTSMRMGS